MGGVQADHAERQEAQSGKVTFNQHAKQRPQEGRGGCRGRVSGRDHNTGQQGWSARGAEAAASQLAGTSALASRSATPAARRTKLSFDEDEDA
jgi:hypothetical protein